jgi:hypothetical protein
LKIIQENPHQPKKPDSLLYEVEKEVLDDLISSAGSGNINLYYFDESGFNLNPNIPYAWSKIGQTLFIAGKRSQNLNVLGFLNTKNSDLFSYTTSESTLPIKKELNPHAWAYLCSLL